MEARQVDENRNVIKAAGMSVDPITGVIVYSEDVKNGIGANFAVQSNRIAAEVTERKNEDTKMSSKITAQANKISLVVREEGGRNVINTASIVIGINKEHGSNIRLQADTINLDGYVTIDKMKATDARIENLVTGRSSFDSLVASSASLGGSGGGSVRIYGQTVRIYQVKDINGTTRYLFGYA
jgi:hypothetical protein